MKNLKEKFASLSFKRTIKKAWNFFDNLTDQPIKTSFALFFIISFIVFFASLFRVELKDALNGIGWINTYCQNDFCDGVLAESHGMVMDILIFGGILLIFEKKREKKRAIEMYKSEIDDFRNWDSAEASYRIAGSLRRLILLGEREINLDHCHMDHAKLSKLNMIGTSLLSSTLQDAQLIETNLEGANLVFADLTRANLLRANLRNANIWRADLQGTMLQEASLEGADLQDTNLRHSQLTVTNLKGANCEGAKFEDADLMGANLEGTNLLHAENLTIEQLSMVDTLYEAKLNPEILKIIENDHPHLLENPAEREDSL